jgi:hypothetical protein
MVEPSLTWTCWGSLMSANQFLQSREENWVHHEAYNSSRGVRVRVRVRVMVRVRVRVICFAYSKIR